VDTVRKHLREGGLESHIRHPVPLIPHPNLKKPKEWAKAMLAWTVENWKQVTFSDESIFCLIGSDGMEWCWRKPNEHLDPRFTKKRVKHGGGRLQYGE
jgi:hypothetical protein